MITDIFTNWIGFFLSYNSLQQYVDAGSAFLITFAFLYLLRLFASQRIAQFLNRHGAQDFEEKLQAIVRSLGPPFYLALPIYTALTYLTLPPMVDTLLPSILLALVLFYAVKIADLLINIIIQRTIVKQEQYDPEYDPSLLSLSGLMLKIGVWSVALLLLISNLGYNVTALITGFGVGGIAIAFALQNVLADLFASFSIHVDKPFQKGDFIIIGEDMGTIDHIGLKTTRIATLQGEELVVSNKELTETRIHNFAKMRRRRVLFTFGITYEMSQAKTEKALKLVKDILDKTEDVTRERTHFKEFGDSSLNYEVVYYVESPEYQRYLDKQEEINLAIKKAFEKSGIEMAYPTRTLHINQSSE